MSVVASPREASSKGRSSHDSLKFKGHSYDFVEYGPCRNWIAGDFRDAMSGQSQDVINPRHAKAMGKVALSGAADIEAAVAAAKAAWPAWRSTPIKERAQVLYQLKYLMQRDMEELAWLVSHENGKTFADPVALFLAQDICVGDAELEAVEAIAMVRMSIEDAYRATLDGRIDDAVTLAALLRYRLLVSDGIGS